MKATETPAQRQELIVTGKDGTEFTITAVNASTDLAAEYEKAGFEVRPAPELRRAG
jgi:hypothetical protein